MIRPSDYYDDCTVFEENKTFAEILNELRDLRDTEYTNKERRTIWMTLCRELANTYLDD